MIDKIIAFYGPAGAYWMEVERDDEDASGDAVINALLYGVQDG